MITREATSTKDSILESYQNMPYYGALNVCYIIYETNMDCKKKNRYSSMESKY